MKNPVLSEGSIEIVAKEKAVSQPAQILSLDLTTCKVEDFASFESDFSLEVTKDCQITAIGGYFDSFFAQMTENPIQFSTGPWTTPTHWKQTIFYLNEKIPGQKGQNINGHISVSRPPRDARSLLIKLKIGGQQTQIYDMG
jgi:protein arginine N-methyltransferase 3